MTGFLLWYWCFCLSCLLMLGGGLWRWINLSCSSFIGIINISSRLLIVFTISSAVRIPGLPSSFKGSTSSAVSLRRSAATSAWTSSCRWTATAASPRALLSVSSWKRRRRWRLTTLSRGSFYGASTSAAVGRVVVVVSTRLRTRRGGYVSIFTSSWMLVFVSAHRGVPTTYFIAAFPFLVIKDNN